MGRKRTLVALGGLGLACGLFCAPAMGANVVYTGASADGARVFFETAEKMTPDDGDTSLDVFERVRRDHHARLGGADRRQHVRFALRGCVHRRNARLLHDAGQVGERRHRQRDRHLRALGRRHEPHLDGALGWKRQHHRLLPRCLGRRDEGVLRNARQARPRGHGPGNPERRFGRLPALGRDDDADLDRAGRREWEQPGPLCRHLEHRHAASSSRRRRSSSPPTPTPSTTSTSASAPPRR